MPLSSNGAALQLGDHDNVAVALRALEAGNELSFRGPCVSVARSIPAGHKVAVRPIERGADIIKYGQRMGRATEDISAGEHVHVHNVEGVRGRGDLAAAAGTAR